MAHHRALLASSVMTDYLWMRMITPCIIDPEIPKARRGLTVKGQAICKESSIRFPSGCVVLRWMEQGTIYNCRQRGLPKKAIEVNFKYITSVSKGKRQQCTLPADLFGVMGHYRGWGEKKYTDKLPFYIYFKPNFRHLHEYLSQNWSSDGHFEVLNGSVS